MSAARTAREHGSLAEPYASLGEIPSPSSVPLETWPDLIGSDLATPWFLIDADARREFQSASYLTSLYPKLDHSDVVEGLLIVAWLDPLFQVTLRDVTRMETAYLYGLDRVRFVAPVAATDAVRGISRLLSLTKRDTGLLVAVSTTIERQAVGRVAAVLDWLMLYPHSQLIEARKGQEDDD
jgi:hypothetical protein